MKSSNYLKTLIPTFLFVDFADDACAYDIYIYIYIYNVFNNKKKSRNQPQYKCASKIQNVFSVKIYAYNIPSWLCYSCDILLITQVILIRDSVIS